MADRTTAITPAREERRTGLSRPLGWSGNPFRVMQRLVDEMDRMFDDFGVGGRSPLSRETGGQIWAPDVEVLQRNNELIIRADLPGLKPEEVSVDVTENSVIIHGERKQEHEEEREGYYRSERI
jgi:HSP20 family protein